jgi:hypothetical protein
MKGWHVIVLLALACVLMLLRYCSNRPADPLDQLQAGISGIDRVLPPGSSAVWYGPATETYFRMRYLLYNRRLRLTGVPGPADTLLAVRSLSDTTTLPGRLIWQHQDTSLHYQLFAPF